MSRNTKSILSWFRSSHKATTRQWFIALTTPVQQGKMLLTTKMRKSLTALSSLAGAKAFYIEGGHFNGSTGVSVRQASSIKGAWY